ncbi:MAG: hypothetical protein AAF310_01165 [Myxococcota bacterium]
MKSFAKHVDHLPSSQIELFLATAVQQKWALPTIHRMLALWQTAGCANSRSDSNLPQLLYAHYGEKAIDVIVSYLTTMQHNPAILARAAAVAGLFTHQTFCREFNKIFAANAQKRSQFFAQFFYHLVQHTPSERADTILMQLASYVGVDHMKSLLQQYYYGEHQATNEALILFLVQDNLLQIAEAVDAENFHKLRQKELEEADSCGVVAAYFAKNPGMLDFLQAKTPNKSLADVLQKTGARVTTDCSKGLKVQLPIDQQLPNDQQQTRAIRVDPMHGTDNDKRAALQSAQDHVKKTIAHAIGVQRMCITEYINKQTHDCR